MGFHGLGEPDTSATLLRGLDCSPTARAVAVAVAAMLAATAACLDSRSFKA